MMTQVWVVEQGQYSDYHVVGVFSSRENAQAVVDMINTEDPDGRHDPTKVAEWPLDPVVEDLHAGRRPYLIWMLRDGTVERCERTRVTGHELAGSCYLWPRSTAPAYRGTNTPDVINATVWASDDTHAVKIVNEKRAQMIASGKWA